MFLRTLRKFEKIPNTSCRHHSTRDATNEACPGPINKYQASVEIPLFTDLTPRILSPFKMSNEDSPPVSDPTQPPTQPLTFEPSIPNQALGELNAGIPQPEVPIEVVEMNLISYDARDQVVKEKIADTTTRRQYEIYVKDYIKWWEGNEFSLLQKNPARNCIPAMPITPAKVTLFLNYTLKRPRRSSEGIEIPGTTVGRATVQSTINALEWERSRTVHLYPNDAQTQTNLRLDNRIKKMEAAAKHNEPFRIMLAQARKATGTSADTYTREQMLEISLSCLASGKTLKTFARAVRDRALYLLPLCTAFRGDNIRNLLISDLFSRSVNNHGLGLEKLITCMRILCNNAKNNQSGKLDEQGAIRHRFVELCSIGALALYFFIQFDLLKQSEDCDWTADFSEEAQEAGYGVYGRREWWLYRVFPGDAGMTSSMSYQNHASRIHKLHKSAGTALSKVTHAQRYTAAFVMRANGTSKEAARAMGWSCGDSYNSVYDRELLLEALLGAAMYNAQKPEAHFCARDMLEPPVEVTEKIFPWIPKELAALKLRTEANHSAVDLALEKFFELLSNMRKILVQDLATLYAQIPESFIYSCAPFNSPVFRQFAADTSALLEEAETNARLALQNLPANVAQTFEGSIQLMVAKQTATEQRLVKSQVEAENRQEIKLNALSEQLEHIQGVVEYLKLTVEPPKKRRKLNPKASCKPPLQPNSNMPNAGASITVESEQPIRSMFTAPAIEGSLPSLPHIPDSEIPLANGYQLPTIIPRPDNVMGPLIEYPSIASALQPPQSSLPPMPLPQLEPGSQHHPSSIWESNWHELTKQYNVNQLLQHAWDWEQNHLVPHYNFQKVATFEELWKEYTEGLNGYLPFREIKERWAANPAWHRNEGSKKNEFTRRKKTIDLIEQLGKRSNWTIQKALRFLTESYGSKVLGTFMRELNAIKLKDIITESENYLF